MKARFLAVAMVCLALSAQEPSYTSKGELVRPDNYREWIYLSSGLGMTYREPGAAGAAPHFDNVFVTPQAYKAFLATGAWPDKTMFALEVRKSASKASINKGGSFQDEMVALEVEVKDESRPGKWAYFNFGSGSDPVKPLPAAAGCFACHSANAAVENTFVQFYPTLIPIAKAKGTLKAISEK